MGFGVVEGWEASNPVGSVGYTHDNTTFYSGVQSQRIDLGSADREFHGVAQPGIEVAGETDHRARLGLRFAGGIPAGLPERLAEKNVYVSVRGDSMRVTPHLWVNDSDVDRLFEVLEATL